MIKKITLFIVLVMLPIIVLAYPRGDINGDNRVDNIDYSILINHITGKKRLSGAALKRADINNDNKVDNVDVALLKSLINSRNKVTPTPTQQPVLRCYLDDIGDYHWTNNPQFGWKVLSGITMANDCQRVDETSKSRCCCITSDLKYCSTRNVDKCPSEQPYEDTTFRSCDTKASPTLKPVTPITPTPKPTATPKPTTKPTATPRPAVTPVPTAKTVLPIEQNTSATNRIHFIKQASTKGTDEKLSAGDAILIESNGHFGMVDTGLDNSIDNNFVINYLQSVGVTKLDFIIITHLHRDHTGGLASIAKKFPVSKIYVKEDAVKGHISIKTVKSIAKKNGIKIKNPSKNGYGFTFQQMTIKFYGVDKNSLGGANGDSLLEYITVNGYKILLTGDLYNDKNSIKYLTKISKKDKFKNLDLLKMPHHGYDQNAFVGLKSGTYNVEAYQNFNPKVVVATRGGKCTVCEKLGATDKLIYVNKYNAVVFNFGNSFTVSYS